MRKYLIVSVAILLASCSSRKYAYHFDNFDYNSGREQLSRAIVADAKTPDAQINAVVESPLKMEADRLVASADNSHMVIDAPVKASEAVAVTDESPARSYKEMSKAERKAFRKEAKELVKTYIKAKRAGDEVKATEAAQAMDQDLKMAAIFGAVGIVALIIGGDVFWIIGGIALIIGVVFFVLWLSRQ